MHRTIFALTSEVPDDSQTNQPCLPSVQILVMMSGKMMGSLYVSLILSKTIDRASESGLPELPRRTSKATHIVAARHVITHDTLIWLSLIDDPQAYEDGAFLGPSGAFSAAIVLIVAMFRSERWNVLWQYYPSTDTLIFTLNDLGVSGFQMF